LIIKSGDAHQILSFLSLPALFLIDSYSVTTGSWKSWKIQLFFKIGLEKLENQYCFRIGRLEFQLLNIKKHFFGVGLRKTLLILLKGFSHSFEVSK